MAAILEINGIIEQVDVMNREVRVLHEHRSERFDVPVDCLILLNDERVKLRLLQPTDPVTVQYVPQQGIPAARLIAVKSRTLHPDPVP
jgi:hypothetical protein